MIRDIAAQNAALDALIGSTRAASVPASFSLALFDGDPNGDGVELDATGGYAPVTVANDDVRWPTDPADGLVTSTPVTLAGTDTYNTGATHWLLRDGATGWFTGELSEPVQEPTDTVTLTIFFGDDDF